jgi:hypothetical protein
VCLSFLSYLASRIVCCLPWAVWVGSSRQNVFPCFLRAMKDPFPPVRVAAVKSISHTLELIPPNVRLRGGTS